MTYSLHMLLIYINNEVFIVAIMQCNVVRLTFGCGPDDIDGEISVLDINVDLDTKHCVYIVHIWRKSSSTSIPTHTHNAKQIVHL